MSGYLVTSGRTDLGGRGGSASLHSWRASLERPPNHAHALPTPTPTSFHVRGEARFLVSNRRFHPGQKLAPLTAGRPSFPVSHPYPLFPRVEGWYYIPQTPRSQRLALPVLNRGSSLTLSHLQLPSCDKRPLRSDVHYCSYAHRCVLHSHVRARMHRLLLASVHSYLRWEGGKSRRGWEDQ